ncbi:dolichyl-diphosphooligosaccharide--protein glycosyltransferase subunit 1A-like [Cucurbita moschata]|uniref:Dolichyl-diphosphooligosaccharide--protein glycosyltransferase subunit 1 n=1 Tax=Cucurbita moschata TaxID=3662 RepID=A0A6J1G503_CUCMO|nr:dolichyl-diphosphooligosaccharide--protein glycosyltransferase subunit 1A-like [Cucurbita moschata]
MAFKLDLFLITLAVILSPVLSDLIFSKVDRRIDLTSQIVRISSTIRVENEGTDVVSEVLLIFPVEQAKYLSHIQATSNEGKGKAKGSAINFPVNVVYPKEMPPTLKFYSVSLPKGLNKGDSLTFDVFAVFTHLLSPFPETITQADVQFVLFLDTAYFLSPYTVKVQSLSVKLPEARIEFYTKLENTKIHGSEIKYGPYENAPPYSFALIRFHFENNQPFPVAQELVREIEVSHWGSVQITEHYNLVNGGAQNKGGFSRFDYQTRPFARGASAFSKLVAKLPPRTHSVYYRDEIGNISTSHLWGNLRKTDLEIEPRYPMFGGWRTSFTIGYSLPLQDFLFQDQGKRFLNISFGSPINEVVVDRLIVRVVLPEGSSDFSVSVPFSHKQWHEKKISHLDIDGRPVVVLEKENVVPEHNQHFQVYYKFNSISMLREPIMLIFGFFVLFVSCIIYMHSDMSISKSSPSYLAKLQWDEVQTVIQQVQNIINRRLTIHDKLDASLRDLSRTGDVQACKAARKAADASLKELSKELKSLLSFLQSAQQATQILPKVEELVAKERDLQERLVVKHMTVVDCYEKKFGGREIENRVASQQQRITTLRQEVDDLLEFIDEI